MAMEEIDRVRERSRRLRRAWWASRGVVGGGLGTNRQTAIPRGTSRGLIVRELT